MALPRLTGALRSFSNVTKQDNYNEEVADLKVDLLKVEMLNIIINTDYGQLFDILFLHSMWLTWKFYLVWCEAKMENVYAAVYYGNTYV
jgi:hypothetical protein